MKNLKKIIWGALLIAAAVLLVLDSFGQLEFELFFEGWWTLFIIVPSIAGIFEKRNKTDSLVGLGIGVVFLLCSQGVIEWSMVWKFILPIVLAAIGIKFIVSSCKPKKSEKIAYEIKMDGKNAQRAVAIFSGTDLDFDNVVFEGAELVAVFGGIDCDLRGAIIDKDCSIKVACVFGGVDIKIPDNVKVVNNIPSMFGGTEVYKNNHNATHTLYIDGACVFGGVDIK